MPHAPFRTTHEQPNAHCVALADALWKEALYDACGIGPCLVRNFIFMIEQIVGGRESRARVRRGSSTLPGGAIMRAFTIAAEIEVGLDDDRPVPTRVRRNQGIAYVALGIICATKVDRMREPHSERCVFRRDDSRVN